LESKLTLTLKKDEFCDDLYNDGYWSMLSAVQYRSNKPIAIGGAAVKN